MKLDLKNTFWLSIPVVLSIWAVSWIFGKIGIGTSQLFSSVSVYETITPTLGNKIFSFISGVVPLNLTLPNIAILFLSAWATLLLGSFIVGSFPKLAFLGKGNIGRMASTIFWGGVPVYLLLLGFKIPSTMVLIGSLIWIFSVAFVSGWIGGWMKKVI